MSMVLFLSCILLDVTPVDPPTGGISALAWVIIIALSGAFAAAVPALWYRGNKIQDTMYADLKACNEKNAQSEEDVLGLMKVVRIQMEQSKGGKPR
jgi:hypothetical protein